LFKLISSGVNKLISFFAIQMEEKVRQAAMMNKFLTDRFFIYISKGSLVECVKKRRFLN